MLLAVCAEPSFPAWSKGLMFLGFLALLFLSTFAYQLAFEWWERRR